MADRNTFGAWWRDVPREQKPALQVLAGVFLIVMTLASVAVLAQYLL